MYENTCAYCGERTSFRKKNARYKVKLCVTCFKRHGEMLTDPERRAPPKSNARGINIVSRDYHGGYME